MSRRFIITESEKNDIRKMYGIVFEQKYMESYPGTLLDFCGYRAIEQFEETMGNPNGESMGDDYFEGEVDRYEKLIVTNLNSNITVTIFQKFPPKLRMQIWSFMFNSTDASSGTVKWLAGIGQAMGLNQNSDAKSEQEYRIRVMNKNSKEYSDVINSITNYKGSWDTVYNNYLNVLDQQYKSTALNNKKEGSYENSWKFRPQKMNEFYDECKTSNDQQQPTPITGSDFTDLRKKLKSQSYPQNIDVSSLKFDPSTYTVSYSPGQTQIKGMSLLIDDRGDLDTRILQIYNQNKQDGLKMVYPKNLRGKSGNLDYQLVYFQ